MFGSNKCLKFFGGRGGGKLSKILISSWCMVPLEYTQSFMSSRFVNIYLCLYRFGLGPQNFPHYMIDVKLCRLQQVAIGKLQSWGLLLDRLYTSGVNNSRGEGKLFQTIFIAVKQVNFN